MTRCNSLGRTWTAVGLALTLVGCGQKDPWDRVIISGTVTYDKQPVELGRIRFLPSRGPVTIHTIKQGKYTTSDTNGVPVGNHRVEITSYDPEEYASAPAGPGAPPVRQLLPKKYNLETELTITLTLDDPPRIVDFDLEK